MTLLSYIRGKLGFGGVEASNTTKGACAEKKTDPIPFDTEECGIVDEAVKCRDEAKNILENVGDETLLLRADMQIALIRLFSALKNRDDDLDLKDAVACLQKLAALGDFSRPGAASESATSKGLTPEVLEEIESRLKLM